ncbi:MAG: hypothetical protein LBD23_11100 [Oscillospiraceae bacterium]|nr:hypothetical protein [Oscillospiraceae bacterium]
MALRRLLRLFFITDEKILAKMKTANLRGRGGAGFPFDIKRREIKIN